MYFNYSREIRQMHHEDSCAKWVKHNKTAKSKRTKPSSKKKKLKGRKRR